MEQDELATERNRKPPPKRQRWSDLSPGQQTAVVVGAVVELIITTIALRDLAKRPRAQVRGWKASWFLICFVQPVGPILYLLVGRRRAAAPTPQLPIGD